MARLISTITLSAHQAPGRKRAARSRAKMPGKAPRQAPHGVIMAEDAFQTFLALANAVLALHVGIVIFVVTGLPLIFIGAARGWRWVRDLRFRVLHLAAIAYVALQAWFGIACPLTTLEQWLRRRAGATVYEGEFVVHWLRKLIFFEAPPWAFTAAYTGFAVLVALAWLWVRPDHRDSA